MKFSLTTLTMLFPLSSAYLIENVQPNRMLQTAGDTPTTAEEGDTLIVEEPVEVESSGDSPWYYDPADARPDPVTSPEGGDGSGAEKAAKEGGTGGAAKAAGDGAAKTVGAKMRRDRRYRALEGDVEETQFLDRPGRDEDDIEESSLDEDGRAPKEASAGGAQAKAPKEVGEKAQKQDKTRRAQKEKDASDPEMPKTAEKEEEAKVAKEYSTSSADEPSASSYEEPKVAKDDATRRRNRTLKGVKSPKTPGVKDGKRALKGDKGEPKTPGTKGDKKRALKGDKDPKTPKGKRRN